MGYTTRMTYDALNRVTKYTDARGNTVRYGYDEIGNLIYLTYPGGEIVRYTYYKNGWLHKVIDTKGQVTASYTYGVYGELLSGDSGLTRFLYNGRCGVTTDDNGLYYMRQRYYNPEIKRFVNQDILTGSISNSQSLNRYSYVQGNPVSYTDPFGLSPLNGLFTGTTFVHCLFGVLGCIPGPVGVVANLADALVYALVDHDYLMAGVSLLGAVTLGAGSIAAKAAKGSKLALGARYVQQASSFLSSGLMFAKNSDNIAQVGGGEERVYNPFRYTGEQYDRKTQLYYLRARYYNPVIGRFMQQDTYLGDGLNLYAYVQNNPVRYVDPSGHCKQNGMGSLGEEGGSGSDIINSTKQKLLDALKDAPIEYRKNPKT